MAAGMPHRDREAIAPDAPHSVRVPMSVQDWDAVSFLHWRVAPEVVRPSLPSGLELDTFDGSAWIGLVSFGILMRAGPVTLPGSRFAEANVRTYVTGPDGRRGLWFFSLDVSRAIVAAGARAAVGLPYCWSSIRIDRIGETQRYDVTRRVPPGPRSSVSVRTGRRLAGSEVGPMENFLTARFCLYSRSVLGLVRVDVEHPAWALHTASAVSVDDELVAAGGLPAPVTEPLVHTSPGVRVRVGLPVLVGG
jgi:uncharacterized protein